MNNEDQNISETVGERRVPKCAKCRNHKIITSKKGHKGLCPFEDCDCPKCRNTDERRAVMKAHIKIRRQLEKQERQQSPQLSTAGPSIQTTQEFKTVNNILPSINSYFGPLFYKLGAQSNISEVSQQSWGSVVNLTDLQTGDSTGTDDIRYVMMETIETNN